MGHKEPVFDLRVRRPVYCIPPIVARWTDLQEEYKNYHRKRRSIDDLTVYLDEIDSVKEIYTEEFSIEGKVIDVGGGQGRLRHFLKDEDVPLYVSVDPYLEVFENMESQPNLLKAYPCLRRPCNFLSCYAENLPFNKNTFDWVHMRSVLDHFEDPYLALKEAYRVLKSNGTILIGLTVRGGKSSLKGDNSDDDPSRPISVISKAKRELTYAVLTGLARGAVRRVIKKEKKSKADDHMFRWTYGDLIDLVRTTGFSVVKEHWQKPPFSMCIYLSAKKR
jgi:ubiquinone/menaquinone biosynthesis C-methylase UbiE